MEHEHEHEHDDHLRYDLRIEDDTEWFLLARKKLNLTQTELGAMVGKNQVFISKIEGGITPLPLPIKKLIITLLKERDQHGE